ncbi:MAG: hypothetical protein ACXVO9_14875 [Bacteroidia bacterium]
MDDLVNLSQSWSSPAFIEFIHKHLLKKKIKFPILEYFTELIFPIVPKKEKDDFLQKIIKLDEIGSYVVVGKFFQRR